MIKCTGSKILALIIVFSILCGTFPILPVLQVNAGETVAENVYNTDMVQEATPYVRTDTQALTAAGTTGVNYKFDSSNPDPNGWILANGYTANNAEIVNAWGANSDTRLCIYDNIIWKGQYEYKAWVRCEGSGTTNYSFVLFNYVDAQNYYFLEISGGTSNTVKLKKRVAGVQSDIATYSGGYSIAWGVDVTITYDYGNITVTAGAANTILFDKVRDTDILSGKIGGGSLNNVTHLKNISVNMTIQSPTNLRLVSKSKKTASIHWDAVDPNYKYIVYRDGTIVGQDLSDISYTDRNLEPNRQYNYTVAASIPEFSAVSEPSTPLSVTTDPSLSVIATPTNLKAATSITSAVISWDEAEVNNFNIDYYTYKVYRNSSLIAQDIQTKSYNDTGSDTGLKPNTQYKYAIVAYDTETGVSSAPSAEITATTKPLPTALDKPVGLHETHSTTSATIQWDEDSANVNYIYTVFRDGVEVGTAIDVPSFTENGLKPNTQYSYTITSYDPKSKLSSPSSDPITVKTDEVPWPTNLRLEDPSTSVTDKTVAIVWDAVGAGYEYKVYRDDRFIATVNAPSFHDAGLLPLTEYKYTVVAYDPVKRVTSQMSDEFKVETISPLPDGEYLDYQIDTSKTSEWSMASGFTSNSTTISNDSKNISGTCIYQAVKFSGNNIFRASVQNIYGAASNTVQLLFNYQNSSNYYFVEFPGTQNNNTPNQVSLKKCINGNISDVLAPAASVSYPLCTPAIIEIQYNNGSITVTATRDGASKTLFDKVQDTSLTSGKVGIKTVTSMGTFSNLYVSGTGTRQLLSVLSQSIYDGDQNVDYLPVINMGFNLPIDEGTLIDPQTKVRNVKVQEYSGGNYVDMAPTDYQIDVLNMTQLSVSFTKPLKAKTMYKLVVNTAVHSTVGDKLGLSNEKQLLFSTKNPSFNIENYELVDPNNNPINIYNARNTNATIKVNIRNIEAKASQPYALTAAIVNSDGKMVFSKSFVGTLNLGNSAMLTQNITIPEDVDSGARFVLFDLSSYRNMEILQVMQPFSQIPFEDSDFIKISTNNIDNTVTIYGVIPNMEKGRNLTLLVLNPNKDPNQIADDNSAIQKQDRIVTGEGGTFSISFPIHFGENAISGNYKVYLGGDDFTAPKCGTFYLATKEDKMAAINNINNTNDLNVMKDNLLKYEEVLSIKSPLLHAIDLSSLANILLDKVSVKKETFDVHDEASIRTFIMENALLIAYNTSVEDVIFSSEGDFLYSEILKLDILDAVPQNLTVYKFFTQNMTEAGKRLVQSNMLGKNYNSMEALRKDFIKNVVVYGIQNCNAGGWGHIYPLLTVNGTTAGLDLSGYNSENADKLLLESSVINSIQKLQTQIDELSRPVTIQQPERNGGGKISHFNVSGDIPVNPQVQLGTEPENIVQLGDMSDVQWALPSVLELIERKVIAEPPEGNFRPNDEVTREEFIKMVVLVLKLDISKKDSVFDDVYSEDWSAPYIVAAKAAGIINGIDEKHFGKQDPITRQDVAVIVYRSFKLEADKEEQEKQFNDSDTIAPYATDAVRSLVKAGIINGMEGGRFAPYEHCTRAQSAKIICGMLKQRSEE